MLRGRIGPIRREPQSQPAENDSPPEGGGIEPSVPVADSITRRTGVLGEVCPPNQFRKMRRRFYDPGSGCRMVLVCRGRCRIEFTVALLDTPRADVALHRNADMVWAI